MADRVYNGMPAGELPDLQWRLAGGGGAGVEMARLPDGQLAVRNAADRKSTRLNSSHRALSRMPSSA